MKKYRPVLVLAVSLLCASCSENPDKEREEFDQMVKQEEDNSEWILPPEKSLIGGENGPIAPEMIIDERVEQNAR